MSVETTTRPVGSPLTAGQADRLEQMHRMIVKVREPEIAPIVARLGYGEKAHKEGVALYAVASGINRPFEHALTDGQRQVALAGPSASVERYRTTDDFENTWVPRLEDAIRYYVTPAERAQEVLAGFFLDLSQQPMGPAVVGSVDLFLVRLEGLRAMPDLPGKAELLQHLEDTGLTEAVLADMRQKVDAAQLETPAQAPQPVSEEELRAADEAQLAAFDRLELWYTVWAGIFRQKLDYHTRVRLGVSAVKGGHKKSGDAAETEPTQP